MAKNDDFRDSIERSREAMREHREEPGLDDDARRNAVRSVVADVRAGFDVAPQASVIGTNAGRALHPFFQGLLDCLPTPGETWPADQRDQWLETARNIFALLYVETAPSQAQQTPRLVMRNDLREEQTPPTPFPQVLRQEQSA